MTETPRERLDRVLNRVAKWRSHFAGWQLGTRLKDDPESQAVRDAREMLILLRIEANAVSQLLIRHHLVTAEELMNTVADEAELLDKSYAERWPGCTSSDLGMVYKAEAADTMKGWLP